MVLSLHKQCGGRPCPQPRKCIVHALMSMKDRAMWPY